MWSIEDSTGENPVLKLRLNCSCHPSFVGIARVAGRCQNRAVCSLLLQSNIDGGLTAAAP